jgi:ribosomal protein S18 acetylase RimI-like enzyme
VSETLIHRRVAMARAGENPYVITKLKSGWVVIGDVQPLDGYCLLLSDPVVPDLNVLNDAQRQQYCLDTTRIGDALLKATDAYRINYETWGNTEQALHTHIMPRYMSEAEDKRRYPACTRYDWKSARPFDPVKDRPFVERMRKELAPFAEWLPSTHPEIITIQSPAQLEACYSVMKELRPELTFQEFVRIYELAKAADSYTLAAIFEGPECIAVMGYRILHDYVDGRHLYVDDLVTSSQHRSRGIGARLLKYAEEEAQRLGCSNLRLCTGVANTAAMKFYEREGWASRSVVYKKKLGSAPIIR